MVPDIFDRRLVAQHLRRATGDDFVTRLALDDLGERLLAVTRSFDQALILAPDARGLPEGGMTAQGVFRYVRAATVLARDGVPLVDPEALALPETGYDLIVSMLDLSIVNDVPGFLARLRAHLRPDGLFIGVTLGGATLTELRQAFLEADAEFAGGAFARVAPFMPVAEAPALLQRAGFALPVADLETHSVRHADALALLRELKALGAQNPLRERPTRMLGRAHFGAALAACQRMAGDPDGRVRTTLELVWMSGWAPDASQQQPARRGSATISLKDVLEKKG